MDVASIERDTAEVIRCAAVEVAHQGGDQAVHSYLKKALGAVVAVAHAQMGKQYAYQLLNTELKAVEALESIG
jgi:hypothetical protein